ncbi:MAG TPA: hypothetical protein VMZ92_14930 [Planctomycetota bacterium]|nr:hypothetical protein [Planctomycetota bacterium]
MSGKLFLNAVGCAGGRMLLGFAVGTTVVLTDSEKLRDLPGGLSEYAMTVSNGDDAFNIRTIADGDGNVEEVIASAGTIPDDWHETLNNPSEE